MSIIALVYLANFVRVVVPVRVYWGHLLYDTYQLSYLYIWPISTLTLSDHVYARSVQQVILSL